MHNKHVYPLKDQVAETSGFCLLKYKSQFFYFAVADVADVNEENWLDEFRRIRKSEKLTIETYHSMRKNDFYN